MFYNYNTGCDRKTCMRLESEIPVIRLHPSECFGGSVGQVSDSLSHSGCKIKTSALH